MSEGKFGQAFDAMAAALVATEHEFQLTPAEAAEVVVELAGFVLAHALWKAARISSTGAAARDLSATFQGRLEALQRNVAGDWLADATRSRLSLVTREH